MKLTPLRSLALLAAVLPLGGCDSAKEPAPPAAPAVEMTAKTPAVDVPAGLVTWTGDLPALVEKRVVRLLVVYSKTFYFIDKGQQRGITYDLGMELEKQLNTTNKDKSRPFRVMFIPVARNQLLPSLAAGVGDIATGGLTITPERLKTVDFTAPATDSVNEIRVTAPDRPGRRAGTRPPSPRSGPRGRRR